MFSSTSFVIIDSSFSADRVRQAVSSAAGADDLVVMFETAEYAAETLSAVLETRSRRLVVRGQRPLDTSEEMRQNRTVFRCEDALVFTSLQNVSLEDLVFLDCFVSCWGCVSILMRGLLVSTRTEDASHSSAWTFSNGVNVTLVASRFVNCSLTPLAMINSRMVQVEKCSFVGFRGAVSGTGDSAGAILYSVDGNNTASKGVWSLAIRDCVFHDNRLDVRDMRTGDLHTWTRRCGAALSIAVDGLASEEAYLDIGGTNFTGNTAVTPMPAWWNSSVHPSIGQQVRFERSPFQSAGLCLSLSGVIDVVAQVSDCVFSQNSAWLGSGMAVHVVDGARNKRVNVTGVQFMNNVAPLLNDLSRLDNFLKVMQSFWSAGAGLEINFGAQTSQSAVTVAKCRFQGNVAATGGALHVFTSDSLFRNTIVMDDCLFINNTAASGAAVGVLTVGFSELLRRETKLGNNSAKVPVSFKDCVFHRNVAVATGTMSISSASVALLGDTVFTENVNIALDVLDSQVFLHDDVVFKGNWAQYGAGIHVASGFLVGQPGASVLLDGNIAMATGGGIYVNPGLR